MADESLHFPFARPFRGKIGVGRRDITPPEGIALRNWGAAAHSVSRGVHRPLTATALVLGGDDAPLAVVALDLGWWRTHEDEWVVRGAVLESTGLDPERVILALSHTHSGPSLHCDDDGREGWELVRPYLESVGEASAAAVSVALAGRVEGELAFGLGTSAMATDRDLSIGGRTVCGFDPAGEPDQTLLVGRAADAAGRPLATVVNYACHPTTLAWQNEAISPDWVGAMREIVESTTGAPCLYLQGASGELAPRLQYVGETEIADANGRALGHAVLATLDDLPRPGHRFELVEIVESGATQAIWRNLPAEGSRLLRSYAGAVPLAIRPPEDTGTLARRWREVGPRQAAERLSRARLVRRAVGPGPETTVPFWVWRVGDGLVVAQPCEAYSDLQTELRRRLAPLPVTVISIANGCTIGYLVPADLYDDRYPAWQTPFAGGSLERLTDAIEAAARELIASMPVASA